VELRSIAWATVAGLVVAVILQSRDLVFATLAAAALAALVVVSRRRIFRAFTFTRVPARRVVPWGGRLDVTLTATNAKLLPVVWLRISDEWPAGIEPRGFALSASFVRGTQGFSQTISLRWYERVTRHYQVRCVARGLHGFGPAELEAGDPFGIAGVARPVAGVERFVVLPKVLRVPALDALVGHPLVEAPADRSLAHDPTALRGTRLYRPGDPLRAVNWRATARRGVLHTNEFDPTTLAAVKLLVDVGVTEHAWQGVDPERVELLCVVAASLAAAVAERGSGVGIVSNAHLAGKAGTVDVEPREGALDEVLESLARVLVLLAHDFRLVLEAELADVDADADCLLVVPALRPPVRPLVEQVRRERGAHVVYVGEPSAAELPLVDAVVPATFDWRAADALGLTT
jgi:uncharacterized protein (DUF58 family)